MRYEIQGDTLPVVICYLDGGEKMITEKGAMSWMSPNMHMATSTNGGIGKAFGRMFSGESMFQNIYTAQGGPGMIAFASCFPGSILPYQISPGRELIVQKSGFLASEAGVNLSVFFQKRFGSGFFGGEGFIMQRLAGEGMVFLEFDGHVVEYDLQPGQQIIVDTGYLAAMEATCFAACAPSSILAHIRIFHARLQPVPSSPRTSRLFFTPSRSSGVSFVMPRPGWNSYR